MINLIYRDGAPENTGHYEIVETDANLKLGEAVALNEGKAVLASEAAEVYGIVCAPNKDEAGKGTNVAVVLKVAPGMIFKAPFKAPVSGSIKDLKKGASVIIVNGGGTVTAKLVDMLDAVAEGDMIEVCFE